MEWTRPEVRGYDIPSFRVAATSTVIDKHMYLFGGFEGYNWVSQLFRLDLETHRWTFLEEGDKISPRCRHSSISLYESKEIVIFGGNDKSQSFNELRYIRIPEIYEPEYEEEEKLPSIIATTVEETECQPDKCEATKFLADSMNDRKYTDITFKIQDNLFKAHLDAHIIE